MKKFFIFILVSITMIVFSSCGESYERAIKDFKSDYTGGLNRRVTVYDYNGQVIKSWEGKFDTQMGDSSGVPYVKFDMPDSTGRKTRVIIQGGVIINEEL